MMRPPMMRNCTSRYKRSVSLSALPSPQSTESTESETETDLCNKLRSFALQPSRLDKLLAEIPTETTAPTTKEVPTPANEWDVHLSQLGPRTGHRMMQPDSPQPATYPPSPIASAHNQPSPTLAALATTATTTATIITTTPDDGLKTFIKEVLRKQAELFESKLAQQQQQQQRQLAQLKQQLISSFQQQLCQVIKNSEPTMNSVQSEIITITDQHLTNKTKKTNTTVNKHTNKHEPKQKNQQTNKRNQPTKALTEHTLFPPPTERQTRRKPIDAIVLGSSIVKHIKGKLLKKKCNKRVKVCSFPGATTEKINDHTKVKLKYSAPTTAIVHAGGNDLADGTRADVAVENITAMCRDMREKGIQNIAVSSMTPRYRLKWDILNINHLLKHLCKSNNYHFIDNSNINYYDHVCDDGVHLNHDGVYMLTNNYSNYLKHVELGYEE